jgi:hypothetical protein
MSSPNIKLQSLIRRYKNGLKEVIDKKKIINDYTYQINIDETYDSKLLFNKKNKELYDYPLDVLSDLLLDKLYNKSDNTSDASNNTMLNDDDDVSIFPMEMYHEYSNKECSKIYITQNVGKNSYKINEYIHDKLLYNMYNVELCDKYWLINMYFMNRLYNNFSNINDINIKSLYINNTSFCSISSMNHFLKNSKLFSTYKIEWNWLVTINQYEEEYQNTQNDILSKYLDKTLMIIKDKIYTIDNINYIINETMNKLGKINLLNIGNVEYEFRNYFSYLILSTKLLETNCILILPLPAIKYWDCNFVNLLLLYTLFFKELYIFKFNLDDSNEILYLICKNKKKSSNEILYKKLLFLLKSEDFLDIKNLFPQEYFSSNENIRSWLNKIYTIINKEKQLANNYTKSILFDDILDEINEILEPNFDTFL